jgi:hypothetical protein
LFDELWVDSDMYVRIIVGGGIFARMQKVEKTHGVTVLPRSL